MKQQQSNSKRPSRPKTIYGKQLSWQPYEAGDEGEDALSTIVEGYELRVGRSFDEEGKPSKTEWSWSIHMTSAISETPELVDAGSAKSESGAKTAIGEAFNKERRSSYKAAVKAYPADHADEAAKATEAKSKKPVALKASRVEPTEEEKAQKSKTRRGKIASGATTKTSGVARWASRRSSTWTTPSAS